MQSEFPFAELFPNLSDYPDVAAGAGDPMDEVSFIRQMHMIGFDNIQSMLERGLIPGFTEGAARRYIRALVQAEGVYDPDDSTLYGRPSDEFYNDYSQALQNYAGANYNPEAVAVAEQNAQIGQDNFDNFNNPDYTPQQPVPEPPPAQDPFDPEPPPPSAPTPPAVPTPTPPTTPDTDPPPPSTPTPKPPAGPKPPPTDPDDPNVGGDTGDPFEPPDVGPFDPPEGQGASGWDPADTPGAPSFDWDWEVFQPGAPSMEGGGGYDPNDYAFDRYVPGQESPWGIPDVQGGNRDFYRNQFVNLLKGEQNFQDRQRDADAQRQFALENPLEAPALDWSWADLPDRTAQPAGSPGSVVPPTDRGYVDAGDYNGAPFIYNPNTGTYQANPNYTSTAGGGNTTFFGSENVGASQNSA